MLVKTEKEMLSLGREAATNLVLPAVFELIGDVGTGKTTFTRGLAKGLGVKEPVTSPSFTISKRYDFALSPHHLTKINADSESKQDKSTIQTDRDAVSPENGELVHYDFYRLDDPGLMREELDESLTDQNSVIVVEWGGDVSDLLPSSKYRLEFFLNPDNSRTIILNQNARNLFSSHYQENHVQPTIQESHVRPITTKGTKL